MQLSPEYKFPKCSQYNLQKDVERSCDQCEFAAHLAMIDLCTTEVMRVPVFVAHVIRLPNDDHMREGDSSQREDDCSDSEPIPNVKLLPADPSED